MDNKKPAKKYIIMTIGSGLLLHKRYGWPKPTNIGPIIEPLKKAGSTFPPHYYDLVSGGPVQLDRRIVVINSSWAIQP